MRAASSLLGFALAIGSLAPPAMAQSGGNIDLQTFRPAMDSRGYITVDASQVLGPRELSFGLVTSWGRNLLTLEDGAVHYRVQDMISPTLVGALGLRFAGLQLELGAAAPFTVMSGDRDPDSDGGTPDDPNDDQRYHFQGQGLGDVALHAKLRLLDTSRGAGVGVALVASVGLPTATQSDAWMGDDSVTPQATLVVDRELGRVSLAANAGFRYRLAGERSFQDLGDGEVPATTKRVAVGATLPVGAALAYAVAPQKFDLVGEVSGELPLAGENYFPLEALGGLKLYLARNSFLMLGGGVGLLPGRGGTPDARAFLGIVFEPNIGDRDGDGLKDDVDRCPDDPEDFDDFEDENGCPDLDNDRDEILDVDDQCPNEPEDRDGVEDQDGCPDPDQFDRDGDGILDQDDECPDDPEDLDQFEDADGCPDLDNDQDHILDVDDLCPDDPEDPDHFEDADGCPDPDNDHDRILDTDDDCPRKDGETAEETAEVWNTVDDDDGCPDRGPVDFEGGRMVVLDKIYFEYNSAVIKPVSFDILDVIASTINLNPDITRIEVQGHTDERGSDEYNLALSQARAESVVRYLVEHDVARDRLVPQGYGERVPKERAHTEQAWAANRRVEFVILEGAKP